MGYNVGLDIGVGSVGWSVVDDQNRLMRKKGKNLIGVRLFEPADTAAQRRTYRTTRRRLARRHWRLGLLNEIFAPALAQIGDAEFLHRLQYSWIHPDDAVNHDNWHQGSLFGNNLADKAFYQKYPTIYHLRAALMQDSTQHDLREVYLAIHHLMKYRGNFLMSTAKLNLAAVFDVQAFGDALQLLDPEYTINNSEQLVGRLVDTKLSRTGRVEAAREFVNIDKRVAKEIFSALVGLNVNAANLFEQEVVGDEAKLWKFNMNDVDIDDKLSLVSDLLGDADLSSFLYSLKDAFDGLTLQMLLKGQSSLSAAMVAGYETHKQNWAYIKTHGRTRENKAAVNAAYKQLLSDNPDEHAKGLKAMLATLDGIIPTDVLASFELADNSDNFLPRQRTKANGTIPVQLHAEELARIIANQSQYYPFLKATYVDENGDAQNKLMGLLKFRVPYYVGPMVVGQNAKGRDQANHWMVRKTDATITPWNFKQVIDTDESAKKFINAMISTDTYLFGEPALAKHTPTYEKYNVLQELNNVRLDGKRLDVSFKQAIFDEVFTENSKVKLTDVAAFLMSKYGVKGELSGLANSENKFNANLTSYHYLKKILGAAFVADPNNAQTLDEIVTLQTVFEDAEILTRQLHQLKNLTDAQVNKLARKHFTGWGNLSAKLLQTPFIKTSNRDLNKSSILDLLYTSRSNLMEIMNDDCYGVQDWLTAENMAQTGQTSIDDLIAELAGPRDIKRAIKQSFNILLDIQRVMGGEAPSNIFLEFARDTQASRQTNSRYNALKRLYDAPELKKTFKKIVAEFKEETKETIQNDRIFLYYTQMGLDFYTGEELKLHQLHNYDVDHIIPQAFTKDNSLDNRVLVNRAANNRKSNGTIDRAIIENCQGIWYQAFKHNLITEKKLKRLTHQQDWMEQAPNFIARQLVETRQIIKNVAVLAKQLFPSYTTTVQAVRAEMTSDMRKRLGIMKNRDVNDYHHAFDSLLMMTVGLFMQRRGIMQAGKVSDNAGNEFNLYAKQYLARLRQQAADTHRQIKPYGFVIDAMFSDDAKKRINGDGEIVFDNVTDVAYLRQVLAYKKILLTRPTRIGSGQLYKETQFPNPQNDVKARGSLIPVKGNKATAYYGGFSASNSAYMTLVRVEGKKDAKNVLVKIPMSVHKLIESGQMTVERYIRDIKQVKDFARILMPVVKLDQLVIDHGELVYLTTSEFRHSAESLWLPISLANEVKHILNSEGVERTELLTLFDAMTNEHVQKRMPIYAEHLQRLQGLREQFIDLEVNVQQDFLIDLMYVLQNNAGFRKAIKKYFKKEKDWPNLQTQDNGNGGIKLLDDAEFIYQSPTGLYEKRICLRELI
ncbi:type II CRISPR RNA-guided endonuclease Cas9 [Periweissella ghanensis]|uniref:CRISPR-associated endonuclease Cas9 n=1 Tax=Periweissella ghanensis TaxID=467997 RepID=A0ABM8ZAS6_9LACO|nr:type II CRISPR RNA-guided endonuclease Cas9 [Periweissella ghanensis]MCM0601267.1 type II CRISPR RNA-guided endonuclease Cas9 [Periweissella ghanensis]CAH0418417.1 CRISPR-associated endonuclease Cas9 2 [Periweissella ghanensis]